MNHEQSILSDERQINVDARVLRESNITKDYQY